MHDQFITGARQVDHYQAIDVSKSILRQILRPVCMYCMLCVARFALTELGVRTMEVKFPFRNWISISNQNRGFRFQARVHCHDFDIRPG